MTRRLLEEEEEREREGVLLIDCMEEEDGREGREGRRKQQEGEDGRWAVLRVVGRVAVAATLLTAARDDRTTMQRFRMMMTMRDVC
jgi:hypothetical protein